MMLQWVDETIAYHVNLLASNTYTKPACVYLTLGRNEGDYPSMKIKECGTSLYKCDFVCELSARDSPDGGLAGSSDAGRQERGTAQGVKLEKKVGQDAELKIHGQSLVTCPAGHLTFAFLACDSQRFVNKATLINSFSYSGIACFNLQRQIQGDSGFVSYCHEICSND